MPLYSSNTPIRPRKKPDTPIEIIANEIAQASVPPHGYMPGYYYAGSRSLEEHVLLDKFKKELKELLPDNEESIFDREERKRILEALSQILYSIKLLIPHWLARQDREGSVGDKFLDCEKKVLEAVMLEIRALSHRGYPKELIPEKARKTQKQQKDRFIRALETVALIAQTGDILTLESILDKLQVSPSTVEKVYFSDLPEIERYRKEAEDIKELLEERAKAFSLEGEDKKEWVQTIFRDLFYYALHEPQRLRTAKTVLEKARSPQELKTLIVALRVLSPTRIEDLISNTDKVSLPNIEEEVRTKLLEEIERYLEGAKTEIERIKRLQEVVCDLY